MLTWPYSKDLDEERGGYQDDGKVDGEVHAAVGDSGAGSGLIHESITLWVVRANMFLSSVGQHCCLSALFALQLTP